MKNILSAIIPFVLVGCAPVRGQCTNIITGQTISAAFVPTMSGHAWEGRDANGIEVSVNQTNSQQWKCKREGGNG